MTSKIQTSVVPGMRGGGGGVDMHRGGVGVE